MSRRDRRTETVPTDSAAPPPGAADGAPSAVSAGLTRPADGALTGSAAGLRSDVSRNLVPPAVRAAGGTALPRAQALSGSVRTSQSSKPFTAADGASPSTTPSDAPASRPGWGSGRDVPPTFDAHVDRAFAVGGFAPVVDPLGPRLVEPAPLADPALREPERVWIAVRRTDIDRHRPARGVAINDGGEFFSVECTDPSCPDQRPGYGHAHLPRTVCGRSIRTGNIQPVDDPWIVEHTQPCPRCWPGGA